MLKLQNLYFLTNDSFKASFLSNSIISSANSSRVIFGSQERFLYAFEGSPKS